MEENLELQSDIKKPQLQSQPEKKKKSRVGYFFLSLTPPVACILLQLILGVIYTLVVTFYITFTKASSGVPFSEQDLVNSIMETAGGSVMLYHVVGTIVFGLWYYFGCKKPKLKQSIKNLSGKAIIISLLGGFFLCLLTNGIVGVEQYIIPDAVKQFEELMQSVGMGEDFLTIFSAVVLAPIGEEYVLRGLTLYYAKKAFPKFWMANVFQALMFGIIHLNLIQGIYAFVIGLFLGYVTERYHSILPAMIVHFVVNFCSTFVIEKLFVGIPDIPVSYILLVAIPTAIISCLIYWGGPVRSKEIHE